MIWKRNKIRKNSDKRQAASRPLSCRRLETREESAMLIRKILVPYDFSQHSEYALAWAIGLAEK